MLYKVWLLVPANFFSFGVFVVCDICSMFYEVLNISLSTLKRVTNNLAKENAEWLNQEVKTKNEMSNKDDIRLQVDRLVISNDGGRLKIITSNEAGRKAEKNLNGKKLK